MEYPLRGFLLGINPGVDQDNLKLALDHSAGALLTQSYLVTESIPEALPDLRSQIHEKIIVLDTRLDYPAPEELATLSLMREIDVVTVIGTYGQEPIRRIMKGTNLSLYSIIDIGTQEFRTNYSVSHLAAFAKTAKESLCRGVVMTALFPDRISTVRNVVGNDFEIVASSHPSCSPGDGIRAGANLEILPFEFWSGREEIDLIRLKGKLGL